MPLQQNVKTAVDATATGVDSETEIGPTAFAGAVLAVNYYTDAAITGANTNSRTIQIVNRGQSGAGSTVVAQLALTSGVNAVKGAATTLTLQSPATVTPNGTGVAIAQGDVLAFVSTHIGTGLADPGGEIVVVCDRAS